MMEDCGCRYEPILGPAGQYVGGNIWYCPLHTAAPEMLQAFEDIVNVPREGQNRTYAAQVQMIMVIAGAAIAHVAPPDMEDE